MKSNRFSVLVVLALVSAVFLAGCVNPQPPVDNTTTTSTTVTTTTNTADPVGELTSEDDVTGIPPEDLDALESDLDDLDADVSAVSETDV